MWLSAMRDHRLMVDFCMRSLLVLTFAALTDCSSTSVSNASTALVGKWQSQQDAADKFVQCFDADGTWGATEMGPTIVSIEGTYRFDGSTLTVIPPDAGGTSRSPCAQTVTFSSDQNSMHVVGASSCPGVADFTRVDSNSSHAQFCR